MDPSTKAGLASALLVLAGHALGQMCDCPGPDKPLGNAPNCQVACFGELFPNTAKSKAARDALDKAGETEKAKQIEAKKAAAEREKKLTERANERANAAQYARDIVDLQNQIKGPTSSGSARGIVLKPIPPAKMQARSQLDCIAGNAAVINGEERNNPVNSWDKRGPDCTPAAPGIAPPSPPASVALPAPTDPAQLQEFLSRLGRNISTLRQTLAKQDQEIRAGESALAQSERGAASAAKPEAESDALRRAKAALEKAKADRAHTAEEMKSLETQQSDARSKAGPAPQ